MRDRSVLQYIKKVQFLFGELNKKLKEDFQQIESLPALFTFFTTLNATGGFQ